MKSLLNYIFLVIILIGNLECNQKCGKQRFTSGLVVGGDYSLPGQWPWLASLFEMRYSKEMYICGSTLISNFYVLTGELC